MHIASEDGVSKDGFFLRNYMLSPDWLVRHAHNHSAGALYYVIYSTISMSSKVVRL